MVISKNDGSLLTGWEHPEPTIRDTEPVPSSMQQSQVHSRGYWEQRKNFEMSDKRTNGTTIRQQHEDYVPLPSSQQHSSVSSHHLIMPGLNLSSHASPLLQRTNDVPVTTLIGLNTPISQNSGEKPSKPSLLDEISMRKKSLHGRESSQRNDTMDKTSKDLQGLNILD